MRIKPILAHRTRPCTNGTPAPSCQVRNRRRDGLAMTYNLRVRVTQP